MPGFIRYFSSEPTRDALEAIEGVSLIEILPTTLVEGAGTGVVCIVGEFEDGPYNTPTEVLKPIDLVNTFGGFGFTKDGKPYQHPVARRSGGSELWNGNGSLALYGKRFSRLVVVRVNTSSGQVQFSRLACLTATKRGPYDLEPGDTAAFEVDGAPVTATIVAVAGQIDASGGIYPTNFVGTEYLVFQDEFGNQTKVQFAATDQAITDVIAAINKQLAYTAASNNAGQLRLVSKIRGSGGYIALVGGTAGAITQLGLTLTNTAEVDRVTVAIASTGTYTFSVTTLYNGQITTFQGTYAATVGPDTATTIRDALLADFEATNPNAPVTLSTSGLARINIAANTAGVGITTAIVSTPNPGDFVTANVTPNSTSFGYGNGNVKDVDRVTDAEIATMLDLLGGIAASKLASGYVRACNDATPVSGTLKFTGGAVGLALGWTVGQTANANAAARVIIPAGTRIEDAAGYRWVTMQTYETDTSGGEFSLDVRPAEDDDSTPTAPAGTASTLVDVLDDGFVVDNAAQLQRLSPGGFDAAYRTALAKTIDPGGAIPTQINIIFCARTTAAIMQNVAQNAIDASAKQHALRKPILSAPVGTSVADLRLDPDIGVLAAGKDSRVFYTGPSVLVYVPMIAELGVDGGTGFSDDGLIQQHFDGWYASIRSIIPPEENAGQDLRFTPVGRLRSVVGMEKLYNSKYGGTPLGIEDYIAFAAAGIIAPMMDPDAGCNVQSDLTSLPSSENVEAAQANYRFMFDYIGDSLRLIAKPYVKQLKKPVNRTGLLASIDGFLRDLLSENNPDLARIAGYQVSDQTSDSLAAKGNRDVVVPVKMLQTDKYINFRLTVGTSVELTA